MSSQSSFVKLESEDSLILTVNIDEGYLAGDAILDIPGIQLTLTGEQDNSYLGLRVNDVGDNLDYEMAEDLYIRVGQPSISYESTVYIHSDDHDSESWLMSPVTILSGDYSVITADDGIVLRLPENMRWNPDYENAIILTDISGEDLSYSADFTITSVTIVWFYFSLRVRTPAAAVVRAIAIQTNIPTASGISTSTIVPRTGIIPTTTKSHPMTMCKRFCMTTAVPMRMLPIPQ